MTAHKLYLDHEMIRKILPHTGQALVIDTAEIHSPSEATGFFSVLADDARIVDHFNVMPGHLIAEFCHLTGAVLLMRAGGANIPILNATQILINEAVLPGDDLLCQVSLTGHSGRAVSFSALVKRVRDQELVATVSFTGTSIPRRIFDQLLRRRTSV